MKSHNSLFYLQAQTAKGWGSAALLKMRLLIKQLSIEPCQVLELSKEKTVSLTKPKPPKEKSFEELTPLEKFRLTKN